MAAVTRLIHMSDLHLGPLAGFAPRHWNIKRALGYVNWQRRRRHIHRHELVSRLVDDIRTHNVHHWMITGDLINIGLPAEYELAARWLTGFGPPEDISVVPGNHDIYTHLWTDPGVDRWKAYMTSDDWGQSIKGTSAIFPFVRRKADVCIVGVNSAVPTPPGVATGLVGSKQLDDVRRILRTARDHGLFRIVMIHHPPLPGLAKRAKHLRDADALQAVLCEAGAELVVYGHNHVDRLSWLARREGPAPVIGIASASVSHSHGKEGLGRYNLIDVVREADRWLVDIATRGFSDPDAEVCELERHRYAIAGPGADETLEFAETSNV